MGLGEIVGKRFPFARWSVLRMGLGMGKPEYHAFMKANEGTLFRTREHSTHVEYQTLLKDILVESDFLGFQ